MAASAVEHMQVSRGSEIDRFLAQPHVFGGVEHVFRPEVISGVENTSENVFFIYSRVGVMFPSSTGFSFFCW